MKTSLADAHYFATAKKPLFYWLHDIDLSQLCLSSDTELGLLRVVAQAVSICSCFCCSETSAAAISRLCCSTIFLYSVLPLY